MLRYVVARSGSLLNKPTLEALIWRGYSTINQAGKSSVLEVHDDAEFAKHLKEVASSGSLCVVDFSAKWCGPCKMIGPIYDGYSQQYKEVKFLKVDIDNPDLLGTISEHEITGVPAFFFYKGAKRVDSFTGARPDLLLQFLKKHEENQQA